MSQKPASNYKHGLLRVPRFKSVGHCLAYYNYNRPADYKPPTNGESYGRRNYSDFDLNHPHILWSCIAQGIKHVLDRYPANARIAWSLCNLGDKTRQWSAADAALYLNISKRTVERWLGNIYAALEKDFIDNFLIPLPPPEEEENKS